MTKGILIFAQGKDINYLNLAKIAAKRAKKFLNLPVAVVVDYEYDNEDKIFDQIINKSSKKTQIRIVHDGTTSKKINWLNFDRVDCFDLTPYDETIVIDADYIINSDHLLSCFNMKGELLLYNDDYHLLNNRHKSEFLYINEFGVPFYWATVFYFKKTSFCKEFFKLVRYIRENWVYYSTLYQIKDPKYRNDFAFSIAVNLLTIHMNSKYLGFIPGKLYYITDKDILVDVKDDYLHFILKSADESYIFSRTHTLDIHIMNKESILRVLE